MRLRTGAIGIDVVVCGTAVVAVRDGGLPFGSTPILFDHACLAMQASGAAGGATSARVYSAPLALPTIIVIKRASDAGVGGDKEGVGLGVAERD